MLWTEMWRYGDALRLGYPDLSDGEFWILPPLGMSRGIHFFFRIVKKGELPSISFQGRVSVGIARFHKPH